MNRHWSNGAKVAAVVAFGSILLALVIGGVPASGRELSLEAKSREVIMLRVTQDESSTENQISEYLRTKGLRVLQVTKSPPGQREQANPAAPDGALLLLFSGPGPTPDFRFIIDTQRSGSDPARAGQVTERVVIVRLCTGTFVPSGLRRETCELLCSRHRQVWAGTYSIEADGELVCTWALNITASGLPAENVFDAVQRLELNWAEFYPTAKRVITHQKTSQDAPRLQAITPGLRT